MGVRRPYWFQTKEPLATAVITRLGDLNGRMTRHGFVIVRKVVTFFGSGSCSSGLGVTTFMVSASRKYVASNEMAEIPVWTQKMTRHVV
jgi:hypothetical protein